MRYVAGGRRLCVLRLGGVSMNPPIVVEICTSPNFLNSRDLRFNRRTDVHLHIPVVTWPSFFAMYNGEGRPEYQKHY